MKKKKKQPELVWGFIGENRSGRTVTIIEEVGKWKKENKRGKIICFDPTYSLRQKLSVNYLIDTDTDWRILSKKVNGKYVFKGCLLVIDSIRLLMKDSTPAGFLDFLMKRNDIGIKIMYSTSPAAILERLSYFTSKYSIFYNDAEKYSEKIPQYVNCHKASEMVRTFVGSRDRLVRCYPKFPHIVLRGNRFKYNNMNKELKIYDKKDY